MGGLKIHDLAHSFGDRVALDGVTFDIEPEVVTGLLGLAQGGRQDDTPADHARGGDS